MSLNFRFRSKQKELLDQPGINKHDLIRNLYELELINKWLGGHKTTLIGIKKIINRQPNKVWRIIDLGCGGGDTLRAIEKWAISNKIKVELTGVDLLADAIEYANSKNRGFNIQFVQSDFNQLKKGNYDIAISSLFCHHLYDSELEQLLFTKLNLADFALINDLHRHKLAYYSIKLITILFSKSYLVKNDACLSVAKAFKKSDFNEMFLPIINVNYSLQWVWAFRWLVVFSKQQ